MSCYLQNFKKCYICDEDTNDYCKSIFQLQTQHSETLIYKFLEKFLEKITFKNKVNYDENRNIICQKCLLKLDEYDLAVLTAKNIEYELTQLLIDSNEKYEKENNNNINGFTVLNDTEKIDDYGNKIVLVEQTYDTDDFQQEIIISNNNDDIDSIIEYQYVEEVIDDDFKIIDVKENIQDSTNENDKNKIVPVYTASSTNKNIIVKKSAETTNTSVVITNPTSTTTIKTEKRSSIDRKSTENKSKTTKTLPSSPHQIKNQSNSKTKEKKSNKRKDKRKLDLSGPPFKCPNCFDLFQYKTDLFMHLKIHDDSQVICDICGKTFKSGFALNSHIRLHENVTPFECDVCGKKFKRRGALNQHMLIHTGERKYHCQICDKKYIHHSSYRMHKKAHANIRDKKCSVCGIGFGSNSHLNVHMLIHTGEKPHACPTCGKTFAKRCNMNAHYRAHLGIRRVYKKSHICPICNSGFTKPVVLRDHISSQHKLYPAVADILLSLTENEIKRRVYPANRVIEKSVKSEIPSTATTTETNSVISITSNQANKIYKQENDIDEINIDYFSNTSDES